jgi:hypothetical protein
LLPNKVPARSSKWFSDKGICIMVLQMWDWAGDAEEAVVMNGVG